MKLGRTDVCRHCDGEIMLCRIRGGDWLPFDVAMIERTPGAADAYVPVVKAGVACLVPIGEVGERRLADIHWLARQHRCAEFYRAVAAQHENVPTLADAMTEFADFLLSRSEPRETP